MNSRLMMLFSTLGLAACDCKGGLVIGGDAGAGGGAQTSDAGGTRGGGAGGGSGGGDVNAGGGFAPIDAGDGTVGSSTGPGGFTLDGGATTGEGSGVGLVPGPDGGITLLQSTSELHYMWIANAAQGWVSKYDTRTGREVGRYYSVMPRDCANSLGPPCNAGNVHGITYRDSNSPSRTAIDLFGDMWVANRAPTARLADGGSGPVQRGSVTKIANDVSDCVDRNGNGRIDTSRDLNNDGQISTAADAGEMIVPANPADPVQYDECVLFTTPLGGAVPPGNIGGRALAIGQGLEMSAGDVWVGIFHESAMYKLNPVTGQPRVVFPDGGIRVPVPFGAYGALVDRLQRLWVIAPGVARLAQVDTTTGAVVRAPDGGNTYTPVTPYCRAYGFAVDHKNRIWMPNFGAPGVQVCRYDPATNTWDDFPVNQYLGQDGGDWGAGRGIAVSAPQPGYPDGIVYMSAYLGYSDDGGSSPRAELLRLNAFDGGVVRYPHSDFIDATDARTSTSIGVGLDGDGQPWVNNSSGNVMRIDNATGDITRTAQQPAGLYTYSDFTGYQARTFTAPLGTFRRVFTGCSDMTEWRSASFRATTPPNTSMVVFVRAASTIAGLATAPRYGPLMTPADLQALSVPKTRYLQIEFELRSADGLTTPVLHDFAVRWACPVAIQ